MTNTQLFDPKLYKHWVDDHVRFGDLDAVGHVNNNAIGQYFEHARALFFREVTPGWPHLDHFFVLARTAFDFYRELHLPATVRTGCRVLKLGRTSMTLGNALFSGDAGIAYCESVSVLINRKTRAPTPIPDDLRTRLQVYT